MELQTERLRLRPPDRERDLAGVVLTFSDPDVARFVYRIPSPYTVADAEELFSRASSGWQGGAGANRVRGPVDLDHDYSGAEKYFAIVDALTDAFLGVVFVELREGGEVGYVLAPEARGRGVMTEAVRAVVRWAQETGIRRLCLTTDPANVASQRVAERAGFIKTRMLSHDPPLRGGRTESFLYEWWA